MNANLPPTTCTDKDAFSKETIAVHAANCCLRSHLEDKASALVKKSTKVTNSTLCFVQYLQLCGAKIIVFLSFS